MGIVNFERLWVATEESPLIENTELTLSILRYLAKDDVPFPANLSCENIQEQFHDEGGEAVAYSIICAYDSGLLMGGQYHRIDLLNGTVNYTFGSIDGLSQSGGEYVRNAMTHFDKARALAEEMGWEVTTATIKNAMAELIKAAIAKAISGGGCG